jgi:hypothetical protein
MKKTATAINDTYQQLMKKYGKTFKEISLDKSHHFYMTDCAILAVDFDTLKTDVCKTEKMLQGICSCDALYSRAGTYILVEFKNGEFDPRDLQRKIAESLLLLLMEFDETANWLKENASFMLVYNKIPSKMRQHFHLKKKAGKLESYLQLTRFSPLFLKEVHAYTIEEFEKELMWK